MKEQLAGRTISVDDQFEQMLRPYMASMRRYCMALTGSAWDGDDLFQRALIKIFNAWRANKVRTVTKAYLFRIISNAWIDHHRKAHVPELVKDSFDDVASRNEGVGTSERLTEAMRIVLNRLNARQRLVYLMQAGWGLTASEAAELCGESEGNVRVIYHRARKRILSRLADPDQRLDETLLDRYIAAFQSDDTEQLLALYREETAARSTKAQRMPSGPQGIRCLLAA